MFCPSQIKNYIITAIFLMHLLSGWNLLCRKENTISYWQSMKGAIKYINSLLRFPNKTVNFLSKLFYYSTKISLIFTKIENKNPPTPIFFGNICCPFHDLPVNVSILCVRWYTLSLYSASRLVGIWPFLLHTYTTNINTMCDLEA